RVVSAAAAQCRFERRVIRDAVVASAAADVEHVNVAGGEASGGGAVSDDDVRAVQVDRNCVIIVTAQHEQHAVVEVGDVVGVGRQTDRAGDGVGDVGDDDVPVSIGGNRLVGEGKELAGKA